MDGDAVNDAHLQHYRLGKTLGIGSVSKVKIARHVLTNDEVAIKIFDRGKIKDAVMEEKASRVLEMLRLFEHPHIVRHYETIETQTRIYSVMEYIRSGELFDYVIEQGRLLEVEARHIFQQMISGVEYCHQNKIVHCNLRLESLLLDSDFNVKIAGFGLRNIVQDGHFLNVSNVNTAYTAPEAISGELCAGPEVDVWTSGVVLYALLCGSLPFDDENVTNLTQKIEGGIYTLPNHVSPDAGDLIRRMLLVDPSERITIHELRTHPWFRRHVPSSLAAPFPDIVQQEKQ